MVGIAKGEGGVGEDFRWMVLGGEEKGGGVVVDLVVGGEVGKGAGGEDRDIQVFPSYKNL